jgi:hypothetical protein
MKDIKKGMFILPLAAGLIWLTACGGEKVKEETVATFTGGSFSTGVGHWLAEKAVNVVARKQENPEDQQKVVRDPGSFAAEVEENVKREIAILVGANSLFEQLKLVQTAEGQQRMDMAVCTAVWQAQQDVAKVNYEAELNKKGVKDVLGIKATPEAERNACRETIAAGALVEELQQKKHAVFANLYGPGGQDAPSDEKLLEQANAEMTRLIYNVFYNSPESEDAKENASKFADAAKKNGGILNELVEDYNRREEEAKKKDEEAKKKDAATKEEEASKKEDNVGNEDNVNDEAKKKEDMRKMVEAQSTLFCAREELASTVGDEGVATAILEAPVDAVEMVQLGTDGYLVFQRKTWTAEQVVEKRDQIVWMLFHKKFEDQREQEGKALDLKFDERNLTACLPQNAPASVRQVASPNSFGMGGY